MRSVARAQRSSRPFHMVPKPGDKILHTSTKRKSFSSIYQLKKQTYNIPGEFWCRQVLSLLPLSPAGFVRFSVTEGRDLGAKDGVGGRGGAGAKFVWGRQALSQRWSLASELDQFVSD